MKIVFTGGGTGGHFYPIIAVVERVNEIINKENIIGVKLYYISDKPYDKQALFENNLTFKQINAGKMRLYFSFKNFFDIFTTFFGVLKAIWRIFLIYPDVIFSKGGYASFPVIFAAKIFRIPLIIHESDVVPGRVNKFSGKFAKRIAISFKEAREYFKEDKTVYTGQPVRREIEKKEDREEGLRFWKLESNIPVILVLGGSQGAEIINHTVIDALPKLVEKYQIIHQTGVNNFENTKNRANVVLGKNKLKARYNPVDFMSFSNSFTPTFR